MTRRSALAGAALLGAGAGLDRLAATTSGRPGNQKGRRAAAVGFHGAHQAGIATPQQRELAFAAFDVAATSPAALRELLERWTAAAAALTAGKEYAPAGSGSQRMPSDPGEAAGLGPARLTLTFGFGPTLFQAETRDRFGLAHQRPAALEPLPPFDGELLDPTSSGGDLCVQACADDPQVAFHAIHTLTRVAGPDVVLRWMQRGFWPAPAAADARTPRNLLGFKDGTANIHDDAALERFVWVQPEDGPSWMHGGSYLITRRIEIWLESWDALSTAGQEQTIGRHKRSGAPLGAGHERDPLDLRAVDRHGKPLIPLDAHVRVAAPSSNAGQRILRRGYSYSNGARPGPLDRGGHTIDSGLFFIAFVRDPARQFVPLQRRLATDDALNAFTLHTASAIFACPPGTQPGGLIGEQLLT